MPTVASTNAPEVSTPVAAPHISHGLVLSGGGALAAYEVGIMKALLTGQSPATNKKMSSVEVVSATSAGSVNASLFLSVADQGLSAAAAYLEKVWLDDIGDRPGKCSSGAFRFRSNPARLFNLACYFPDPTAPWVDFLKDGAFLAEDLLKRGVRFSLSSHDIEQRALEFANLGALITDNAYRALLRNKVRFDKVRSSQSALRIATTNWKTGQLKIFGNEDMTDQDGASIVLASSAIPGLFDAVEILGEPYVDGGVVMNTPLKPAIDAGADVLHVIYMDPEVAQVPFPRLPNTASALNRALVISFGAMVKRDIITAAAINKKLAVYQSGSAVPAAIPFWISREAMSADITKPILTKTDRPYRQLTLHLHHPSKALGAGWFSFERTRLQALIEHGFNDAVDHDCIKNQCIFPG